jgi:hypothetical protein
MARQKRRTTKKSRSQSPAARPRLTLGAVVRVKDGVMDPDYDGYGIGGWSGAIIAWDTWEQTPMALIAWDATTQRDRIAPEGRRRAASQGLSAAQMWLHLSEGARVDRAKRAPRSEVQPREQGGEPSAASWTPPSCGHGYPDVLRLRDEVRADGTFVRMTDCRHCGRAEIPFPASMLAEELRLELEATDSLAGIAEEEIEAARQRAERRRRQHRRAGRWWQRWWRSFVRPR